MDNKKKLIDNEVSQLKAGHYDVNVLVSLYLYDQGLNQMKQLAKMVSQPEEGIGEFIEAFRKSPEYREFYPEVSQFCNRIMGKQESEILKDCVNESAELMKAYSILDDRRVSPATIAMEGNAKNLLESVYFQETFGERLEKADPVVDTSSWKQLMMGTCVAQNAMDSYECMKAVADWQRSGNAGDKEFEYYLRYHAAKNVNDRAALQENYRRACNEAVILPEVAVLRNLYDRRDKKGLADALETYRDNPLAIEGFVAYLTGDIGKGLLEHEDRKAVWPELVESIAASRWFADTIGYGLEGVNPYMMTRAQYGFAQAYDSHVFVRQGQDSPVVNVLGHEVDVVEMDKRLSRLNNHVVSSVQREHTAEMYARGGKETIENGWFQSEEFVQSYGEGLAYLMRPATPGDVMVIESYRENLDMRISQLGESLSLSPSEERIADYGDYERLLELRAQTERHAERIYTGHDSGTLRTIDPTADRTTAAERAVALHYDTVTGAFRAVRPGTVPTEGYSIVARYTTEKEAIDFVRMADLKKLLEREQKLSADNMRNEFKIFRSLPADSKEAYLAVKVLSESDIARIARPDLTEMKRIVFEQEQKVAFDRANPGVADVIKTDENRHEYQMKVDKDAGVDRGQKNTGGRSV